MKVQFESVTPVKAKIFLSNGMKNRSLSKMHVSFLAKQMKDGRWMDNGETIVIDSNNRLIDGQHRMAAIVEADMPVKMLIARNADPQAMATIDTGKKRSVGDVFSMNGVLHGTVLSSSLMLAHKWDYLKAISYGATTYTMPSPIYMLDIYSNLDEDKLGDMARIAGRFYSALGAPMTNSIVSMLIIENNHGARKMNQFFDFILNGGDYHGSPTHYFQIARSRRVASGQKRHRYEDLFLILYFFESWIDKKTVKSIKYNWLNTKFAADAAARLKTGINWEV